MRVDYTLPALMPGTLPDSPDIGGEESVSFRDVARGETVRTPVDVEHQLRLDVRPFTGTYVGPPPRPANLDLQGVESQRYHWRNILWRHGGEPQGQSVAGSPQGRPVDRMLQMLWEMQDMGDSISAQDAALTRG
ncbi:MAG TPA: hypothetical protein VK466_02555 [Terriglobales bacterium]|nr:hypothetical protein [Terriglobales bacterium]